MRVLVTGANGMLGFALTEELKKDGLPYVALTRADVDLSDTDGFRECVRKHCPELVFHCAAYTQVDRAETDEACCRAVNVAATEALVQVCRELDAELCYISTDYVFDGRKEGAYTEQDVPSPLGVYGRSKADAELAVQKLKKYYIIRTSWTYSEYGNNFLKTMLRLGKELSEIAVVDDQTGAPVYAKELARLLLCLTRTGRYGIYHVTGQGVCSFAEYARFIMETAGLPAKIEPVTSEEYARRLTAAQEKRKWTEEAGQAGKEDGAEKERQTAKAGVAVVAERPKNSRLGMGELAKAGIAPLPDWKESVKRCIECIQSPGEQGGKEDNGL